MLRDKVSGLCALVLFLAADVGAATPAAKRSTSAKPQSLPMQVLDVARRNEARIKADQFAEPEPVDRFVGQEFRIELNPSATYSAGVLELSFTTSTTHPNRDTSQDSAARAERHPSIEIVPPLVKKRGQYAGQNSFGAMATISVIDVDTSLILVAKGYVDSRYSIKIPATGAEAKALAASARLVVKGTIVKLENGKVVGCERTYSAPTITSPYSGKSRTCWVATVLNSASMVDTRTGTILRTWAD
jgi:hypothetical protein